VQQNQLFHCFARILETKLENMKISFVLLVLILLPNRAHSQEISNQSTFSISYFGILGTHPGVKFGIQHPITTFNKSLESQKQLISGANVIVYLHRRNQIGLGFNIELGYRDYQVFKNPKEVMFGLGYLRTFLPNKAYIFDQEGALSTKLFSGSSHLMKSVSVGIGKNPNNTINSDFWMIKPTVFHIKPFNSGSTLNFAIDAGYYFK
jgi:hypothetical protein